jgi:hypothetical protein
VLRTPADNRKLLEAAGYAWDEDRDAWVHPRTRRELAGRIARTMTEEQLTAWLKAGAGRPPLY